MLCLFSHSYLSFTNYYQKGLPSMNKSQNSLPTPKYTLQNATGPLAYNMTNDYLFRAVLQKSNKALRGLICSLLHLTEEEVLSVSITNPVILGDALESKEFRLDINVSLNNNTFINLEMQVVNQYDWQNRSVGYLCRSYDQLQKGEEYNDVKPVIHIGFLDYTLFPDSPEFYATYKLLNVKNHQVYSDNLILSVIDLTQINLATEEDKAFGIDYWASLFKAATWEEIKMLAQKNDCINEASNTMFQLSSDELIRKRCRDREEYYQDIRSYKRDIAALQTENVTLQAEITRLLSRIAELENNQSK